MPVASAVLPSMMTFDAPSKRAVACARISALGSTATTREPAAASWAEKMPVPAPMSATTLAGERSAQATSRSISCGAYPGRALA